MGRGTHFVNETGFGQSLKDAATNACDFGHIVGCAELDRSPQTQGSGTLVYGDSFHRDEPVTGISIGEW